MRLLRHFTLGLATLAASSTFAAGQIPPSTASLAAPKRSALLIGIDTYQPSGRPVRRPAGAPAEGRFAAGLTFTNLKGPSHDLEAMRSLLTGARFGFPAASIHVLADKDATREAMLAAMRRYLVEEPSPGDTVVLYVSGHGSLRVNSKGNGESYMLDGSLRKLDNTIVPADAYLGAEDIDSLDLQAIFNRAADKGVHLTVLLDACHSGGQARGADASVFVPRDLAFDPRDLMMAPDQAGHEAAPQDRSVNPVLILSAAQKDQSAIDVQSGTPHGMFTQALVHALKALPAGASAADVFQRLMVEIEVQGATNQQPALDTTGPRRRQPLFGGTLDDGPRRATVVGSDERGVLLDVGSLTDIGPGSEFTELNGTKAVLRVRESVGVERSRAEVVRPNGFLPKPTDVLELTHWKPASRPPLYFYLGATNLSRAQVETTVVTVRSAGLSLVNDPSRDAWSQMLSWTGSAWQLEEVPSKNNLTTLKPAPATVLGPRLTVETLQQHVIPRSTLWLNVPLPSDLAYMGGLSDADSAARATTDRMQAAYILAGNVNSSGVHYAWYRQSGFNSGVQTPPGLGNGCSPGSPYPLRTDWIDLAEGAGASSAEAMTARLGGLATNLARLHAWLNLEADSADASPFGYKLALKRTSDGQVLHGGEVTERGQHFDLILEHTSPNDYSPARWVYVLDFDCQGKGDLLWPRDGLSRKYPSENGRLDEVDLPIGFRIGPPFGTDTYILLTTSTELPNPYILQMGGVAKDVRRGGDPPSTIEKLLRAASAGTRGTESDVPTDWGVQILHTNSR